ARVAEAIRRGDATGLLGVLRDPPAGVEWIEDDAPAGRLRAGAVQAARAVIDAARAGDATTALRRLGAYRLLCAHRRGPHG
ncbi:hypothetical protein WAJ72_22865, partial [Acinetobacter baumannii]